MTTRTPLRPAAAVLAAALALAACDSPSGLPPVEVRPLTLVVQGRAERGSVVTVVATAQGSVVPAAQVTLTVTPADAAEVMPDGRLRLLRTGAVNVDGASTGHRGTVQVTVARPPVVVFDRLQSGNRDIWRVDLDGQALTRLTSDPGDDQDPTVAQGTVVFISYRNGNGEIYSMPLAGGAETRLTSTAWNETTPSLSPAADRIAYAYDRTGVTKLWTVAVNGTGAARATPADFGFSGSIETAPAWAPTSPARLVFVATNAGSADLYDYTLPASFAMMLGGDAAEVEPAWSADGQWVVFTSNRAGPGNTDLFLLRLSSGAVTRLTTAAGSEAQPTWTADGRIVYVETVAGVSRLRWLDPADPATSYPIETGTGNALRPSSTTAS